MNIKKISAIGGGVSLIAGSIFGILEAKKSADYKSKMKTYSLYREEYIKEAKIKSSGYVGALVCDSADFKGCGEYSSYIPEPHDDESWNKILMSNIRNNYEEDARTNIEKLKDFCYKWMNQDLKNDFARFNPSDGYFLSCIIAKPIKK